MSNVQVWELNVKNTWDMKLRNAVHVTCDVPCPLTTVLKWKIRICTSGFNAFWIKNSNICTVSQTWNSFGLFTSKISSCAMSYILLVLNPTADVAWEIDLTIHVCNVWSAWILTSQLTLSERFLFPWGLTSRSGPIGRADTPGKDQSTPKIVHRTSGSLKVQEFCDFWSR